MGQYTSYYLYQKYEQRDGQDPIPCFPNVYSIDGNGSMQKVVRVENDPECGYVPPIEPIYRWYQLPIEQGYICVDCDEPSESGGYLTYVALEDTVIASSAQGLRYSLDSGNTWYTLDGTTEIINTSDGEKQYYVTSLIPSGSRVFLKGCFNHYNDIGIPRLNINSTGRFSIEGNPLSIIYGDNFINKIDGHIYNFAFAHLFANNLKLVDASNLIIPSVLSKGCCYRMFRGCTSLTAVPMLPANTLTEECYLGMFDRCTSLATAPVLSATTLANYCYEQMFCECTSLTTAPELPSTTLAKECYSEMFRGCTSLTAVPMLPANTLAEGCYLGMFDRCTSLTTAPVLSATTLANNCYAKMFAGCTSLTTPPELPSTELANHCYAWMFSGCTSLTDLCDYQLNAMTLAEYCYAEMFSKCTNLTYAPSNLPAIHLSKGCYKDMFSYCTSLIRAPRKIDVDYLRPESCDNMFNYCSSLVEPCYLYAMEGVGDCINCSYMANMYANCSNLDHMEVMVHTIGGVIDFSIVENWILNTKRPFYLLTDSDKFGDSTQNSGTCKSMSENYEYNSLVKYWTELGWSTNYPSSAFDNLIITLATPIENITSVKIKASELFDDRYIVIKSMDDSIEITVNRYKFEVVGGESFYMSEVLEEEYDWVSPAYNSWGSIDTFVNIDLYKHFGKKFYIKTINNAGYRITSGESYSMYENIPSILHQMVDIVCDIENKCEGTLIYAWNTNGIIYEDNNRYEREIYQKTSDDGLSWTNVYPTAERRSNIILPWYRWVNLNPNIDYYCSGTTKMYKQQKQMTYDWINWENVVPAEYRQGDSAQTGSTDCGYVPPTPASNYLTFKALENISITLRGLNGIKYSTDSGYTWNIASNGYNFDVSSGDTVMWKASGLTIEWGTGIGHFETIGKFEVEGNIMSLLYDDNFVGQTNLNGNDNAFTELFRGCSGLTSAENLILPATTLSEACYMGMFSNCSSLTTAPDLPAPILTQSCYDGMFTACSSLSYIKCLATDISANECTIWWTIGVASSGTFVKASSMSSWTTGGDGIPSGWTVQNA